MVEEVKFIGSYKKQNEELLAKEYDAGDLGMAVMKQRDNADFIGIGDKGGTIANTRKVGGRIMLINHSGTKGIIIQDGKGYQIPLRRQNKEIDPCEARGFADNTQYIIGSEDFIKLERIVFGGTAKENGFENMCCSIWRGTYNEKALPSNDDIKNMPEPERKKYLAGLRVFGVPHKAITMASILALAKAVEDKSAVINEKLALRHQAKADAEAKNAADAVLAGDGKTGDGKTDDGSENPFDLWR